MPAVLAEVERAGTADPTRLAAVVPAADLQRVGATREELIDALRVAIRGLTLIGPQPTMQFIVNNQQHAIIIGNNSSLSGSSLNTGTQVSIQSDSPKDDILDAVATLVTAGLGGEWNVEAADDLKELVEARSDIDVEDVQARTRDAAEAAGAQSSQAKELLTRIATGATSGVVATGIIAGLGAIT